MTDKNIITNERDIFETLYGLDISDVEELGENEESDEIQVQATEMCIEETDHEQYEELLVQPETSREKIFHELEALGLFEDACLYGDPETPGSSHQVSEELEPVIAVHVESKPGCSRDDILCEPQVSHPPRSETIEMTATVSRFPIGRLQWNKGDVYSPVVPAFIPVDHTAPLSVRSPYEYFKDFVTDEMMEDVARETNIYSVQKCGTSTDLKPYEFEQLLAIYLRMGLAQMPSVRSYWELGTAHTPVSELMPRNRFQKLLTLLHFSNNLDVSEDQKKTDKIWKLRPWMEKFRQNCLKVEPREHQSIDEIMIAFKGRSNIRQFMKNKPTRWGFKMWARAGSSGIVHDFDVYQGARPKESAKREVGQGLGYEVVVKMASSFPSGHNFKVFADNFFTTDILVQTILRKDIYFLGTVRCDRLQNCRLEGEKSLKKKGRGALDFLIDESNQFVTVRWFDNRAVTLLSSYAGVEPIDFVKRWDKKEKRHIDIPRPFCIKDYNKFMGGIDLMDSLTSLYKYPIKSRRWYMYIFWHTITIAVVNAWLVMRRDQIELGETKYMPLKNFQTDVSSALALAGKDKRKRGRSSKESPKERKRPSTSFPAEFVQRDGYQHWPLWSESRSRCKICVKFNTFVKCEKCEVFLCLNKERNCFRRFHT